MVPCSIGEIIELCGRTPDHWVRHAAEHGVPVYGPDQGLPQLEWQLLFASAGSAVKFGQLGLDEPHDTDDEYAATVGMLRASSRALGPT